MVYVTDSTELFYLSRHAMEELKIISPDFPAVGSASTTSDQVTVEVNSILSDTSTTVSFRHSEPVSPIKHKKHQCGCYTRAPPPKRYDHLPFAPTWENVSAMKERLLHDYGASTFNQCPHQQLPFMDGPPMEVHLKPGAEDEHTAVYTPAVVPIYWQEPVESELKKDVQMGVIEKVGLNTPTPWCHRAFWRRKADGSPRRVVDLQTLNRHCIRSAHHIVPPFQQARQIPMNTVRTVTDAWNGFHSVLIRPEDRHLFNFTTEHGIYRYCVAPQGFVGSGDAYTDRYDRIISDVPRKTKCVDDTALWDNELEEHWWRIIDYLELVGNAGIILNPEKFQFS